MTGMTHQMIALLTAFWLLTIYPLSAGPIIGTLMVVAVMMGALTPDLDQPTANLWRRLLGARAVGNIFQAFSGGHRHLTHSLLGIALIGWGTQWLLTHLVNPIYAAAGHRVWTAFMVGYISHPIADTLTDQGVPWLWPLPWNIKIPPGPGSMRVTTGSLVERVIVRGGIVIAVIVLGQQYWRVLVGLWQ